MKRAAFFFFIPALLALSCGPGKAAPGSAAAYESLPGPASMSQLKGYELYAWEESGARRFAILAGTNREKSPEEIRSAPKVLYSGDELLALVECIPSGQSLTLVVPDGFSSLSPELERDLAALCARRDLAFSRR